MKAAIRYGVFALVILVIGVLVYLLTLDLNHYKPILIETVSRQTGRELRIEGELALSPSLSPVISVQGLTLANAPWSASGVPMLSVGSAEAQVSLLALLSGNIEVLRLSLLDANIALETDAGGIGNWTLTPETAIGAQPSPSSAAPTPFSAAEILLRNIRISYLDGIKATRHQFAINELTAAVNDADSPISFTLDADYDAMEVRLGGTLGGMAALLTDSPFALDIQGNIGSFEISANGGIGKPSRLEQVDIRIRTALDRLSDLNSLAGTALPAIQPFVLAGKLTLEGIDDIRLQDLTVQLGDNAIAGNLGYRNAGSVPSLTMQLHSSLIDLSPFAGDATEGPKPAYLFSREPLPVSLLSMFDLDATLSADILKFKQSELNKVQVESDLVGGKLQTTLQTEMAGGSLSGRFVLTRPTEGLPALMLEFEGSGIELGRLPHDEQKPWFTGGPISLQIAGNSQGNSVADIMGAYNGRLLVEVGAATMPNANVNLFGADLLMAVFNQLNPLARKENNSQLECAVINLNIRDGITAIDRQIALQTSSMSMVGSGEINFRTEELNLGFKPYAREGVGINLGNLAGAARIGGTLANRKVEVDAEGALKAGATAGAALATGGLSLLAQGLFSRTREDPEPCRTALDAGTAANQTGSDAEAAAPEQEDKGLLDNVGSGLKRLFGR